MSVLSPNYGVGTNKMVKVSTLFRCLVNFTLLTFIAQSFPNNNKQSADCKNTKLCKSLESYFWEHANCTASDMTPHIMGYSDCLEKNHRIRK